MSAPVVCVPVKLDAYVLNQSSSYTFPESTVSPISQPNYTFLRLDSALIESDVLPWHDLHNSRPASHNPRLTDLATDKPRVNRQGVYLHWMLPRVYRSGTASNTKTDTSDLTAPQFRNAPDRWIVIRHLHSGSVSPPELLSNGTVKEFTAFVVESNKLRNIQAFDRDVDIEVECSPYIVGTGALDSLDGQAEVFIGNKAPIEGWVETQTTQPKNFVPLNIVGASNSLFADYTPHNANVFSLLDNFEYAKPDNSRGYLTAATADYYVLGWHADESQDPFQNSSGAVHQSILNHCLMALSTADTDPANSWLGKTDSGRVLCHGAMYTVQYTDAPSETLKVPANDAGKKLADADSHPITVGTTALDAVLAYVRAHHDTTATTTGQVRDAALEETENDILGLETLLLSQEEDVDSQQEALDMLNARNFLPAQDSGGVWSFAAAGTKTTIDGQPTNANKKVFEPTGQQLGDLAALNEAQGALDQANRELKVERWNLFAGWWKYVSDSTLHTADPNTHPNESDLRAQTLQTAALINSLVAKVASCSDLVNNVCLPKLVNIDPVTKKGMLGQDGKPIYMVQKGSQQRFFTQRDPSLLVPGLGNPWPNDYLDSLAVRLSSQILGPNLPDSMPQGWGSLGTFIENLLKPCLPRDDMKAAAKTLVTEFFNLHPKEQANDSWVEQPSIVLPLYHDHVQTLGQIAPGVDPALGGRDQWGDTQAWFPLFIEWEVRYYHLPWSNWDFEQVENPSRPTDLPRMRYGIKTGTSVSGMTKDERIINGRVLILPQPGYSLQTSMQQLFSSTNPDDLGDLQTEDDQKSFLTKVAQIDYLSAPLAGFMDHLVTKLNGTHVKPTLRQPGKPITFLPAAALAGNRAGYGDGSVIDLMDIETDKTPYSDYVAFPNPPGNAPLKAVTHGQFKFTKLNIIDKFGQAISAIDPAPSRLIPPIYPNLSEYFHPQRLDSDETQANTVAPDPFNIRSCQYAQYPPTINQDARINAYFLHYDQALNLWRPCDEWIENPVWGYLIVNYAEYALQIFLPDGQFYREVRLGGPTGATESIAWQPFEPGDTTSGYQQLDNLLTLLKDENYLRSFIQMINQSLSAVPHTPNQYAEFLNAIAGRPLALVNTGWSLELANPPLLNQSTRSTAIESPELLDYQFPMKIGDKDRVFDGLVGFFATKSTVPLTYGDELELKKLYTYFPTPKDSSTSSTSDPTTPILPINYPKLRPYYLSATDFNLVGTDTATAAHNLKVQHYQQLQMLGTIIDPFSKLHAYTGILPITSLQLPAWTLQQALQRMTAFFNMGPLLITTPDLQKKYDPTHNLTPDYNLAAMAENDGTPAPATDGSVSPPPADPNTPATPPKFMGIPIPALKSAEWNWLQPYAVKMAPEVTSAPVAGSNAPTAPTPSTITKQQHWNPFTIASLDNKPKYERGPYTAIEGFLQLKKPIVDPTTGK